MVTQIVKSDTPRPHNSLRLQDNVGESVRDKHSVRVLIFWHLRSFINIVNNYVSHFMNQVAVVGSVFLGQIPIASCSFELKVAFSS